MQGAEAGVSSISYGYAGGRLLNLLCSGKAGLKLLKLGRESMKSLFFTLSSLLTDC